MANAIKLATTPSEFKNARSRAIELRRERHGDPRKDFWIRDDFTNSRSSRHEPVFGFSLKVTPADNVSFNLDWTHKPTGKAKRTKIGDAHAMHIEDAHDMAREMKGEIKKGKYPTDKPQVVEARTVKDVMEYYLEYKFKNKKPTAGKGARDSINTRIIPAIGDRDVTKIRTSDVNLMLIDIGTESGSNAQRAALSYFKSAWTYTKSNGDLDADNPASDITPPERDLVAVKERIEAQVIKPEHYPLVYKALDELEAEGRRNPFIIMAIRMMMFTGNRKREVTDIRLEDIDLNAGVINIPVNKTNDSTKKIIITTQVESILKEAHEERERCGISKSQSPYLFVAQSCGKRKIVKPNSIYNGVASVWSEIRDTDDRLANTTPGKSRHGLATLMREMGYSNEQMAMVTRHADPSIFNNHYAFDKKTEVIERTQEVADAIEQRGKY